LSCIHDTQSRQWTRCEHANDSAMFYRPTQPPTLSGTGSEYRRKCGDAIRLGSGEWRQDGLFHLWMNVDGR